MATTNSPVPSGSPDGVSDGVSTGGIRTVVVPAAGLGTRFLPATKTVPKELLPVVDTPGIELIAKEASQAGASRLAVVTSPRKQGIMAFFDRDELLEDTLESRGKTEQLNKVRAVNEMITAVSVNQDRPLGLGHAIGCAEDALDEDEDAFAVLLPDDLVLPFGVMNEMIEVRKRYGGTVLCGFEVPEEEVSNYGVFEIAEADGADGADDQVRRVTGMVEKPDAADAPSNIVATGRYLLDRSIFDALRRTEPGKGGEIQVTDAIAKLIDEGHPVHVYVHRGNRHDLGNPGGFIRACVDFALDDPSYGPSLERWLSRRLEK
ncbi:UTP--glucose-1-phosphate uridylyltransferase [Corynebacterium glyciniphilum]|uniref:UTP--glucose-1-phosphate uridylyltransferase n=1 Tax=Corynebacterium glyciniphilum TaxID=1404244 RepID=UPI0011AB40DB|nr:UTP--glucose-1-phosphate uridylyltransferase [Corynebacterium glyciniphilum]MDN5684578.1 UTP--glucose-1-phosphate uridylyltransferase [Corynebacterium glyciniphilum]MDN6705520.1 UTP--glucose-1-phosphate uridylyltransferase [Corynebacterium glyciniphilum]